MCVCVCFDHDFKYAWDQFDIDLTELAAYFKANGHLYHVFGDGSVMRGPGERGAPTNMYVTDPTGDSIQVDGTWSDVPTGGSGDSLMAPCGQGNCCGKGALFAGSDDDGGSGYGGGGGEDGGASGGEDDGGTSPQVAESCRAALDGLLQSLTVNPEYMKPDDEGGGVP